MIWVVYYKKRVVPSGVYSALNRTESHRPGLLWSIVCLVWEEVTQGAGSVSLDVEAFDLLFSCASHSEDDCHFQDYGRSP